MSPNHGGACAFGPQEQKTLRDLEKSGAMLTSVVSAAKTLKTAGGWLATILGAIAVAISGWVWGLGERVVAIERLDGVRDERLSAALRIADKLAIAADEASRSNAEQTAQLRSLQESLARIESRIERK